MAKQKPRANGPSTRVPTSGPDLVQAWIDYHQTPFGPWRAELRFSDDSDEVYPFDGRDAHETMHEALDYLEVYSDRTGRAVATAHTLDGDPEAWLELAARSGFVECARGDSTSTHIVN